MPLPRIPKPQAGSSDPAGRKASSSRSGGAPQRKLPAAAKPAVPSARPLRTAGRVLRRGGRAAAKIAGAAAGVAGKATGSDDNADAGSSTRSAGRRMAGGAAGAARKAGKAAKRVAGKAARSGGRAARRGLTKALRWLLSTPWGWAVLAVLVLLGLIVAIAFFLSLRQFAESFSTAAPDAQQVSGGGGEGTGRSYGPDQVYSLTAADSHDTTDLMAGVFGRDPSRVSRLSYLDGYPAGSVRVVVSGSEPQMVPGGVLLAEAIPDDQAGMADLVEWMLPQWVAPYPVLVAEPENVDVVDGTWPDAAGTPQPRRLVACDWPDTDWSSLGVLADVLPSGAGPDAVRIEGPWYPEQQHVCHLFAAAQVVWEAWETTFGDDGFVAPFAQTDELQRVLDLGAVRRLWTGSDSGGSGAQVSFSAVHEADLAAFGGDLGAGENRLWSWLSFAAMLAHDDTPVAGQYDCSIADGSLRFDWDFMGDYAASGGTDLGDGAALSPPDEFFADVPAGSLMVPWPCPKPVLAAAAAARRGMWVPIGWAQDLADFGPGGSKLVNGLGVSDAALSMMSGRGFDSGLAEIHGATPKAAHDNYEEMLAEMPEPFDPAWMANRGDWSQHSHTERDDLIAWCAPDTRWVSETAARTDVETDPLSHPKAGLVQGFADDNALIAEKREEAFELLGDAVAIRNAISAEIDALEAEIAVELAEDNPDRGRIGRLRAEIAGLRVELAMANEVVIAMGYVVEYWIHATEQGKLRPKILRGPTWQYECETETYAEALETLDRWHGENLPDEASPLRTVFTVEGAGRAFGALADHAGGQHAPFESMLRLAYASGMLPEPVSNEPMSSRPKPGYVSPSCSAEDWLARRCLMNRDVYYGNPVLVLPKSWSDSRIPAKCPPVYRRQSGLLESLLGDAAAEWDTANEARMVSHHRYDEVEIAAFHPCLAEDMDALAWLTHMVGMPFRAFGWRSFEASAECAEANPVLCAAAGQSRHNYGLAIDIEWQRPECWPPPSRHDESCPSGSYGAEEWLWCGLDHGNGFDPDSDLYLTTPATVGGTYETEQGTQSYDAVVPPEFRTNWCWRLMDLATFGLSGLDERLVLHDDLIDGLNYPIVALHQLPKETWHWSYDAR